jgi:hypothetical protein
VLQSKTTLPQSKVNINKHVFTLVKVCVAVASLFFIYKRVIEKENFDDFKIFISEKLAADGVSWKLLLIVILMFCNWSTEALKWQLLINKITGVNFITSLRAVFSGVTISFFTPNRVGEFAGRMMFLDSEIRLQAVLSTFIGSISQLIITIVAGLAGTSVLIGNYFQISFLLHACIVLLSLALSVVLIFLYIHLKYVTTISLIKKLPVSIKKYVDVFENYSAGDLKKVLAFSTIRFLLFTFQYWLLLQLCGVALPFTIAALAISVIFLVLAVIPTIAFAELAFRGSVALAVLHVFSTNTEGILTASFGLWFINLALPAAAGSYILSLKRNDNCCNNFNFGLYIAYYFLHFLLGSA